MLLHRRDLLRMGAGLAVGAGIAGCGSSGAKTDVTAPGKNQPPTQVAFAKLKPDLPGAPGVSPAFFRYPADPPAFVTGQVGSGGKVTALLEGAQVSTPKASNKWLQNLDKALNVDLEVNAVVSADYGDKLSVTLAGGDFPDLTQIVPLPDLPQVLDKFFVDLTDHIGGDKVKDYPGLAALPPGAWTAGMINGRLYGIAQPRSAAGRALTVRTDIVQKLGLDTEMADGKEFLQLCRELTDAKAKRWAFGANPTDWVVRGLLEMTGGPNKWRDDGGKLVRDIETEEYALALDTTRQLWKEGLIHPDSYGQEGANTNWWMAGTTVLFYQAFEGWSRQQRKDPQAGMGAVIAPKWDGGGPAVKHLGPGHYLNFVAIKKADDARVQELLRVVDYLAAPFGTKEYLTVHYGVEGTDYTMTGTDPIPAKGGEDEKSASLPYVGGANFTTLYEPGNTALVRKQHEYLSKAVPGGEQNAVLGKFSATAQTAGQPADQKLNDLQDDIVQGRQPVSAFTTAVNDWRKSVGDKIRGEYESAS